MGRNWVGVWRENIGPRSIVLVLCWDADDCIGDVIGVQLLEGIVAAEHLFVGNALGSGLVPWVPAKDCWMVLVFSDDILRLVAELRDDIDATLMALVEELSVGVRLFFRALETG